MSTVVKRYTIEGFGQVELNQVAFRRDGRIEAQCKLDPAEFTAYPAENGMLLAIDNVTRTLHVPNNYSNPDQVVGLVYSSEHIYDERTPGLKNFVNTVDGFYPRLGYLDIGDKFTTNCFGYEGFDNDEAFAEVDLSQTTLYGYDANDFGGAIKVTTTKPLVGCKVLLKVIAKTTMPDGQFALKFQVIALDVPASE